MYIFPFYYSKTLCFVSMKFNKISMSVSTFIIVYIIYAQYLNYVKVSGWHRKNYSSQLTFTCSKSRMETVEKGVKYVQS